jgi:PAS domain S-box-containing protein
MELLIGKKLKKNVLWGARGAKDEFQELYNKAKESGKPLMVDALRFNSGKGDLRTWNINLLPQAADNRSYSGMWLLIEDISGNGLPSGSADLFHRFYTAAAQHTEAQPLIEELVCMLKDFSRCDSVKILIVDQPGNQILKAESGSKPGLWDKDQSLSAAVINSFFLKKDDQLNGLYTPWGSLYLNNVNALEGMLRNKLKELVVNTCNSYGFNSLALIPVKLGDSICGFIQLANKNRDIPEDTIATVESISEQLQIIFECIALKREIHTQRESLLKQMHGRGAHLEALSERLKQEAGQRKKAQEELQIRKDLAVALAGIEKIEDALQLCLDTAIKVSGMDSGGIYVLDSATDILNLACWQGLSDNFTAQVSHFDDSEPNTGLVLEGKPQYSPEGLKTQNVAILQSEGIKGLAVVPVMHQGKVVVCLNIASHVFEVVPSTARSALEAVAAEIGSTIARIRDREALAESEGRYGILFAQSKNPVLVIDEAGNYIDGNEAALSFLECTRDELLRMNVRDTLPPYLDDEWLTRYRKIWESGGRVERDYYVWGKIKVLELTITPLEIGGRKVIFVIGTDITERKRLEQELRKSEEKHRSILDQMQDSCYEIDLGGKYTYVNDAMCRGLWYTREELIGKRYRLLMPEEDLDRVYQAFYQVYETGKPNIGFAHKIRRKDGAVGTAESSITLLKNERGEPIGFLCIGRDITQRIRLEEALKQSEEKYRTILEEMEESYVEDDLKGNKVFFNDAACRNLGFTREEYAGMNYSVYTPPDKMEEVFKAYSEVIRTGIPVYWRPFVYMRKDGTQSFVESSVFPRRNEKGEMIGTRTVSRNVTEKKLAAQELEKRALLLDSAYDSIIAFGPEGNIRYVNERAYQTRGYEPDELLTMNIRQLISAEHIPLLEERLAEVLARGELEFQAEHVRKDGSTFPVEGRSRLITVSGQQVIISGYTDITLRKKAEEALRESEALYRLLSEHTADGVLLLDMNLKITYVSPSVEKIRGFTPLEAIKMPLEEHITPESLKLAAELFLEELPKVEADPDYNPVPVLELEYYCKDGTTIWTESKFSVIRDPSGMPVSILGEVWDITERKQAEEKIERLNLMLQAIRLVNQLIVREKDRDQLLQLACDSLVNTRGFKSASIVLLDESRNFVTLTQAGSLEGLTEYMEGLIRGNIPYCIESALERPGPAEIADKISGCVDCPLCTADQDHPVVSVKLWYDEKVYGVLTVSVPENITLDKEEMELVGEVAGDIAFALHNIELEQEKKKSDDALLESEEHFRSLAEESPDMIFIHDMRRIVYANKLCEEIMGYSRQEMYSESFDFLDLIEPAYRDRLRESFAAHMAGTDVPQIEYALLTKSGSRLDVLINTRLITYSHTPAILGVVTDVTAMRRIERALLESENKYRVILEEANEAYLEIDPKGNITFVNDAACRHLGYAREELVGLNYKAITRFEDVHSRVEIWGGVFSTGIPQHRIEYRNVRKDGSIYYAECSIFPLQDPSGKIVGLRTMAQDISRRKWAEEELRKSEEKYRNILVEIDESYAEVDLKGNITFVNDALWRKLGYSKEEVMGLNYKAYTPPDQIREKARIYSEVARTGKPVYWHPFVHLYKDGQPAFSEACVFPLRNEKGEIIGLRTISRDVTQAKMAEHELQKRALMLDSAYDSIIAFNNLGNIIYANERACQTHGYEPAEMHNMNIVDLLGDEDIAALDNRIIALQEKGYLQYEAIHKRKDGSFFPVEGRTRVVDIAGQPIFIASHTDITLRRQMEKALVESESKYRSLVESGGASIAIVDIEGKFTFVNDTLCTMTGYSREEILEKNSLDFVHPEDRDRAAQLFLEARGEGKTGIHMETRALHKDGHIIWFYASPVELKINEKLVGFSVILQDITERKRAEETVRQNEEKYGTILEEIDEHYAEIDAKGNFTFVNEAMCRYFGYSREEMIGMNYKTYAPPESLKQRQAVFSEVFKTGKPTYWQLFEDMVKDGSRRLVEISIFPLKDNEGEIVGLRTIGRDVTDRKQAEANLRESEERYRLLAENSLDVIFTTDMGAQLTYISPSVRYLTGRGAEEIMTMFRQNTLTAESLGVSLREGHRFQQCLKALAEDPSRTEVFEFALKHREGYINWAEVQMSVMRDKFNQAAGILGVIRDISQQKKMTERLVSADRLASLGEMAAGLAHEVNNPLTAVMGFSYLLLQNPDTPEDVRNDVEAIYREGKRAAEIIRNFLTFARGQKPEKQAIYINDILQEVLKLRHNQMENENIQVNLNLWEDLPAIQGDISQLQQVFLNIILNAEYFMYRTNRRGTLTVNTQFTDGKVIVVIRDDGPGVAPEAISRIFDPFYTTKEVGEGTGLGLSICHGIVMEHGGTIFAESELGRGATLIVELPVR